MKTNPQITRIKWFIAFFRSKPKNKWCEFAFRIDDKRCALAFLGETEDVTTPKSEELHTLLDYSTTAINNCLDMRYQQPHPKARILQALRDKLKESKNEK